MGPSVICTGEETGGLQYGIDPQVAPGQIGGVALGENANTLAIDDQLVCLGCDLAVKTTLGGIVFEQVGQRLGVG